MSHQGQGKEMDILLSLQHKWTLKGSMPLREEPFMIGILLTIKVSVAVLLGTIARLLLLSYYPSSYNFPLTAVANLPLVPLLPLIFMRDNIGSTLRGTYQCVIASLTGSIACVIYISLVKVTLGVNIPPSPFLSAAVMVLLAFIAAYACVTPLVLKLFLLTVTSLIADFQLHPSNLIIYEFSILFSVLIGGVCCLLASFIVPTFAQIEADQELKRAGCAIGAAYEKLHCIFRNETPYDFAVDSDSCKELIYHSKGFLKITDAYLAVLNYEFASSQTIETLQSRCRFLKSILTLVESSSNALINPIQSPLKKHIYEYNKRVLEEGCAALVTCLVNSQLTNSFIAEDVVNVKLSLQAISDNYIKTRKKYLWETSSRKEYEQVEWRMTELLPVNAFIFFNSLIMRTVIEESKEKKSKTKDKGSILHSIGMYLSTFLAPAPTEVDNHHRLKRGVHISLAILIANIVPLIGVLSNVLPFGIWTIITIVLISDESFSGTINTSVNRLLGTVTGGITGGAILVLTFSNPIAETVILFIFVFINAYVSTHPRFAYMGNVASLTAIIVMFGYTSNPGSVVDISTFAYLRIQQVYFGVLTYIMVLNVFFPVLDSTLARSHMSRMLHNLSQSVDSTFSSYFSIEITKQVSSHILSQQQLIGSSLPRLVSVIGSAAHEPVLWRREFLYDLYMQASTQMNYVYLDLVRMRLALEKMNTNDYRISNRKADPTRIKNGESYLQLKKIYFNVKNYVSLLDNAFNLPRTEGVILLTEKVAWNQELRDNVKVFLKVLDDYITQSVSELGPTLTNLDILTFNSFIVAMEALVSNALLLGVTISRIIHKETPPPANHALTEFPHLIAY